MTKFNLATERYDMKRGDWYVYDHDYGFAVTVNMSKHDAELRMAHLGPDRRLELRTLRKLYRDEMKIFRGEN